MADSNPSLDRIDKVELQYLLGLNFDQVRRGDRLRPALGAPKVDAQRVVSESYCIGEAIPVTRSYL